MRMRRRWRGSVFEGSGSGDAEKRSDSRRLLPVPVAFHFPFVVWYLILVIDNG